MRLTVEASASWPWTRKARRNRARNNESSTYRVSGARVLLDGDEQLTRVFLLLLGHVGLRRVALESAMERVGGQRALMGCEGELFGGSLGERGAGGGNAGRSTR